MIVLAGDIGGTNARLAIAEVRDQGVNWVRETSYPSGEYPGLPPIVNAFLRDAGSKPDHAAFGVAGPVVDDVCETPNIPWSVDRRELAREIGIPRTALINDFDAVGHGVSRLGPADLVTLQAGTPVERAPIALIGPGTGLGEAFLTWSDGAYHVNPSEGGHADLAPRTQIESGLLEGLIVEFGHVSFERVLSGPGIVRTYRYLVARGLAQEQRHVAEEMGRRDPAAVVTEHALKASDPLCVLALDLFAGMLGAQAGNLALTVHARGGVFVAGGIAPRIIEKLKDGRFIAAFRDKGRLSNFMAGIPVHVIMNAKVGLIGAAVVASRVK